jgi:hypothetical protein
VERLGQLANRVLAICEQAQHPAPREIAQRVEHGTELGFLYFNHTVEYRSGAAFCQPNG